MGREEYLNPMIKIARAPNAIQNQLRFHQNDDRPTKIDPEAESPCDFRVGKEASE